jgi:hypothetical protein
MADVFKKDRRFINVFETGIVLKDCGGYDDFFDRSCIPWLHEFQHGAGLLLSNAAALMVCPSW